MTVVWNWTYAWQSLPPLLRAFRVTLLATVLAAALALVLGLILALARYWRPQSKMVKAVGVLSEFIRRTPALIQVYFVFYALPTVGWTIPALSAGVVGLGVHFATYTAESYRAGIDAVPRGQWDAAAALSITGPQVWYKIILPQALPPILAAQANWVLIIFKGTALLSTITVIEVVSKSQQIGSDNLAYLEPTVLVGVLFFAVSYPATSLLRMYERRIARRW